MGLSARKRLKRALYRDSRKSETDVYSWSAAKLLSRSGVAVLRDVGHDFRSIMAAASSEVQP